MASYYQAFTHKIGQEAHPQAVDMGTAMTTTLPDDDGAQLRAELVQLPSVLRVLGLLDD